MINQSVIKNSKYLLNTTINNIVNKRDLRDKINKRDLRDKINKRDLRDTDKNHCF